MKTRTLVLWCVFPLFACSGDHSPVVQDPAEASVPTGATVQVGADGKVTTTYADGRSVIRTVPTQPDGIALIGDNREPVLVLRTTPRADTSTLPHPTVRGPAPLTVRFNLCRSSDPDQDAEHPDEGDRLNWQFHFGDSGVPAFGEDGTFNADFAHFCRVEHTYAAGQYTATASVTDRHLQDQSEGASALARATQQVTIDAFVERETACAFVETGSQWQAVGDIGDPPNPFGLACACPSNGEVLNFIFGFAPECTARGFSTAFWTQGGDCHCGGTL